MQTFLTRRKWTVEPAHQSSQRQGLPVVMPTQAIAHDAWLIEE
jgi:hypothetical protein